MPDRDRPHVDVVDSSWLAGRPDVVAAAIADAANWRRWWPGLELRVDEDRGEKGMRWFVDSVTPERRFAGAELTGTAEVWLEAMFDGVVAHFFLRLEPAPGSQLRRRDRERVSREFRRLTKTAFWTLADTLDPTRMHRHHSGSHASLG